MISAEAARIRSTLGKPSAEPSAPTLEQSRWEWEAASLRIKLPDGTRVEPVTMSDLAGEWIQTLVIDTGRVFYHLHGGGYNSGSPVTHRDLGARISVACGCRVLLPDYRLAPEAPFPAAIEDSVKGYIWLLEHVDPAQIVVSGDSAGAGLALATLVSLRDANLPLPAAGICLSPWFDLALKGSSAECIQITDPVCSREGLQKAAELYLQEADAMHPLASPLYADLSNLPPLLIQVGSDEILLGDAERLATRAKEVGTEVCLEVWEGMWHVWHGWADLPEARQALKRIASYLTLLN